MSTKINLKEEVQHKVGDQIIGSSSESPDSAMTNSFLHKTVHAAGHDLRSPLFIIRAYSQLLQKTQEKHRLENGFQLIHEATNKMEKTINEFIGLIDIYTQPFPPISTVSFDAAFETAMFQLGNLVHEHEPKMVCDFKDFPTVDFNEKYLADILTYLIDNAIRHNLDKENLEIKIASKKVDNTLVLVVQDNGRGLEETFEKAKNPFYSYTPEEQLACVGMGLSKIQAMAQVSQNSFHLESEPSVKTTASFVFKAPTL